MADVIIAILAFPNDPTAKKIAHQMFVAEQEGDHINLYSVSSILGKEKRVYGSEKDCYITILPPEDRSNGFKVPSFIDCTKMYHVQTNGRINIQALAQRNISKELRTRIKNKIEEMKKRGLHRTYVISENDFRKWNPLV